MYEISYIVFIRRRGPFGLSLPWPKLRTAHVNRPMRRFQRFNLEEVMTGGGIQ